MCHTFPGGWMQSLLFQEMPEIGSEEKGCQAGKKVPPKQNNYRHDIVGKKACVHVGLHTRTQVKAAKTKGSVASLNACTLHSGRSYTDRHSYRCTTGDIWLRFISSLPLN